MKPVMLLRSFQQHIAGRTLTYFIAQQDGRCGLLSAGSWETVLPFCFDSITLLPDSTIAAEASGERCRFTLCSDAPGILPAEGAAMPA